MRATCQMNRIIEATSRVTGRILAAMVLLLVVAPLALSQATAREEGYAVFVSQRNGASQLFLLDLNTRQVSQLTDDGRGHYEPMVASNSGTVVFTSQQGAGFELFRGEIGASWRTRRPTLVGVNRLTVNVTDEISPSLTADGGTIVFAGGSGIEMVNSIGNGRQVIIPKNPQFNDLSPVISPDGQSIAFISNRGGSFDLWLYARGTSELRQVTRGAEALGGVSWSGDSKRIAFTTTATSSRTTGIALADVDAGTFRILSEQNDSNPSLSARGDRVLFVSSREGDQELYMLNLNSGRVERLTNSAGLDDSPIFLATPVARPSRLNQ